MSAKAGEATGSLASIQARMRQRAPGASSVPVYELHAADGTGNASAVAAADTTPVMYSGISNTIRAQSPSVVGTASQSRSLRDRIYERTLTRSPLPPGGLRVGAAAGGGAAMIPSGAAGTAVKDTYAHEQPFPIQTVFEVSRVANPIPAEERPVSQTNPSVKHSDTILTDVESATLIKTLERKLVESAEAADAQKAEMDTLKARVAELEGEMEGHTKTAADATTRLEESQAQCEAARQSIVTAVDAEREKIREEFSKNEATMKEDYEGQVAKLTEELEKVRQSISIKDSDSSSLFTLVGDLQKAVREGAARQNENAEIIARLDRELQESRTRAATVATGFHAKDKQVRDSQGQVEYLQKEIGMLHNVRGELARTTEALAILRRQHDEAMSELVPLRVVADEKKRLQEHCSNLESELGSKNDELGKLRGQVDVVRQQADAAYARSSNFRGAVDASSRTATAAPTEFNSGYPMPNPNTSATSASAPSYASLPVGGSTPLPPSGAPPTADQGPHADALKQLRNDILAEDARTDAERNKWKSGNM